ncbi:hypothetical protein EDD16DRAFT_1542391 [Pisolithus croceorrhizus]|nr:hypothetical protein EDD16DRAFT_1542391 [Pisolithus croceorrhizus]
MLLLPGFVFLLCAHDRPSLILPLLWLLIFLASLLRSSCLKRNWKCPPVRSLLYFSRLTHPSISSCRLALLPSSVHSVVYTSLTSHLYQTSIHTFPDTSRSLFLFLFPPPWLCLYGYPYTVTPDL